MKIKALLKHILTGMIIICLVATLTACSTSGQGNESKNPVASEVVEQTKVEETEVVEASTEEVETTTVIEEPVVENQEEVAVDTMEERLTNLGLQGICVVVWNEDNEEEHVIKDGDSYEEQEGDRFFICTPSMMTKISSNAIGAGGLGKPLENYCEVFFDEFEEDKNVDIQIGCKEGEEGNIQFCMTVPYVQSGYEWTEALGYAEPKMVVWNDTTGLREELEEGEEYQLSEGDEVAMYVPDEYIYNDSNVEIENVLSTLNVATLLLDKINLGQKLDLEMSAMHIETADIVTLHVTLLPPTE